MRFALIGPTYPYRGGIAHYTTLLAQHLRQAHETALFSFKRQYPRWLFPGQSDRDPSERPLQTEAEYLLDPLNPLTWEQTARRIEEWRPDAVIMQWWHPYWAPAWSFLGRRISRFERRPSLIYLCHNILPHETGGRVSQTILPRLIQFTLRPGSGFITHSQADKEKLIRLAPSAAVTVSPHPTYKALGESATAVIPVPLPTDRPLLLFAGFVRPYKGLDILLDALALLPEERAFHLLVAGEFWGGTTSYQRQIERLNLERQVTLLDGYLPNETLAACLQQANVVILPYRSATQSGIIQLAFGQNCPVITTNVGGLAEVVADGKTGLAVPPEDPGALAAAIERYLAEGLEPIFRRNIEEESGRFSWEQLEQAILSLCERRPDNGLATVGKESGDIGNG
jgi:glycosyltransferase involved in cell wall biosynthesis